MHKDNTIALSNGRILGYAEYGDPEGHPVFYFHGGQESTLSSMFMDSIATRLNIRIISPDRPGIGNSSFQDNRKFLDWGWTLLKWHKCSVLPLTPFLVYREGSISEISNLNAKVSFSIWFAHFKKHALRALYFLKRAKASPSKLLPAHRKLSDRSET